MISEILADWMNPMNPSMIRFYVYRLYKGDKVMKLFITYNVNNIFIYE